MRNERIAKFTSLCMFFCKNAIFCAFGTKDILYPFLSLRCFEFLQCTIQIDIMVNFVGLIIGELQATIFEKYV